MRPRDLPRNAALAARNFLRSLRRRGLGWVVLPFSGSYPERTVRRDPLPFPFSRLSLFPSELSLQGMQAMVDMAAAGGAIMLHENEKAIYGEQPERCLDLHQTVKGDSFRATFDPANFVQAGVKPFDDAYPLLKPYIAYFHIKDAIMGEGRVVPAGKGDGQIRELMAAAKEVGYDGFLSLEPHLQVAGHSFGFTGPELFGTAAQALRAILDELDIPHQ